MVEVIDVFEEGEVYVVEGYYESLEKLSIINKIYKTQYMAPNLEFKTIYLKIEPANSTNYYYPSTTI